MQFFPIKFNFREGLLETLRIRSVLGHHLLANCCFLHQMFAKHLFVTPFVPPHEIIIQRVAQALGNYAINMDFD